MNVDSAWWCVETLSDWAFRAAKMKNGFGTFRSNSKYVLAFDKLMTSSKTISIFKFVIRPPGLPLFPSVWLPLC
jgi:hypothetical protein